MRCVGSKSELHRRPDGVTGKRAIVPSKNVFLEVKYSRRYLEKTVVMPWQCKRNTSMRLYPREDHGEAIANTKGI